MHRFTAYVYLKNKTDRSVCPTGVSIQTSRGRADVWPAFATAVAVLSGRLDEAVTEEDLEEVIAYGRTLVMLDLVSRADLEREASDILMELGGPGVFAQVT